MSNATETVRLLISLEIGLFARKNGFSEKTLKFLKMARGIKFAVESNCLIVRSLKTFKLSAVIKQIQGFCNNVWI